MRTINGTHAQKQSGKFKFRIFSSNALTATLFNQRCVRFAPLAPTFFLTYFGGISCIKCSSFLGTTTHLGSCGNLLRSYPFGDHSISLWCPSSPFGDQSLFGIHRAPSVMNPSSASIEPLPATTQSLFVVHQAPSATNPSSAFIEPLRRPLNPSSATNPHHYNLSS